VNSSISCSPFFGDQHILSANASGERHQILLDYVVRQYRAARAANCQAPQPSYSRATASLKVKKAKSEPHQGAHVSPAPTLGTGTAFSSIS
jgi:hypothetical protein